jgi:microcompartment protein CcmL/EutN
MTACDIMVKTAEVDIVEAKTVCPGKYLVLISGGLSSVRAAVDAARAHNSDMLIDSFVLGNPHPTIFDAIYGTAEIENPNALGVMETYSSSAAIVAADTAAKTAYVDLIELRLARGMCGKSYLLLTGEVAAVTAAIERAQAAAGETGMFLDSSVIPSPDPKMWQSIL